MAVSSCGQTKSEPRGQRASPRFTILAEAPSRTHGGIPSVSRARRNQPHRIRPFPVEILYAARGRPDWDLVLTYGESRNHAADSGSCPALWHARVCSTGECPRTVDRRPWFRWVRFRWPGVWGLQRAGLQRARLWRIRVLAIWVRQRCVFRGRIPSGEFCVSPGCAAGLRAADCLCSQTDRVRRHCSCTGLRTPTSRSSAPESGVSSCVAEGLVSVLPGAWAQSSTPAAR